MKVFVIYTCAAVCFAVLNLASGCGPANPAANAQDARLLAALEKVDFDPAKLDPETKRLYDEGIRTGRLGRTNAP